jgi:hypothetical protein
LQQQRFIVVAAGLWKSVSKVTGSYEVGAVVPPG